MFNRQLLTVVFLLLTAQIILAQGDLASSYRASYPPTPTAATFGKFGDVPVSYYNGIPNISIPIYEIDLDGKKIPISLNYHSGGIKVDEEAGWVGLGWNLTAGGCISQTVRGADDESTGATAWPKSDKLPIPFHRFIKGMDKGISLPYSYWTSKFSYKTYEDIFYKDASKHYSKCLQLDDPNCSMGGDFIPWNKLFEQPIAPDFSINHIDYYASNDVYTSSNGGGIDCEPDLYTFNFGDYSGKFIRKRGTSTTNPNGGFIQPNGLQQQVDIFDSQLILFQKSSTTNGWIAITQDGYCYYFDDIETGYSQSPGVSLLTNRTFYLSKIISPKGNAVYFNYAQTSGITSFYLMSESVVGNFDKLNLKISLKSNPNTPDKITSENYYSKTKYLSSITFAGGSIAFTSSTTRDDIKGEYAYLQNINIYPAQSLIPTKTFDLNYSYFTANSDVNFSYVNDNSYPKSNKKLKLESVVERTGTTVKPPYTFKYYEDMPFPYKSTYSRDYWGYYNGVAKYTTIPNLIRFASCVTYPITPALTGNSEPVLNYAQTGTLKSIQYPTGGRTDFEYELNTYSNDGSCGAVELQYPSTTESHTVYDDNTSTAIKSAIFTINPPPPTWVGGTSVNVELTTAFNNCGYGNIQDATKTHVYIYSIDNNNARIGLVYTVCALTGEARQSYKNIVALPPGRYEITAEMAEGTCDVMNNQRTSCSYSYTLWGTSPYTSSNDFNAGGLRVKSIKTYNSNKSDGLISEKYFKYENGKLMATPYFARDLTDRDYFDGNLIDFSYHYVFFSQNTLGACNSASGAVVGYSKVIETYRETTRNNLQRNSDNTPTLTGTQNYSGITEYTFHNQPEVVNSACYRPVDYSQYTWNDFMADRLPGLPNVSDIRNGKLLQKTDYKIVNNILKKVRNTKYNYSTGNDETEFKYYNSPSTYSNKTLNPLKTIWACAREYDNQFLAFLDPYKVDVCRETIASKICKMSFNHLYFYPINIYKFDLQDKTEETYNDDGSLATSIKSTYSYNDNRLLEEELKDYNDGKTMQTIRTQNDYSSYQDLIKDNCFLQTEKDVFTLMANKNILSTPVETKVIDENSGKVLSHKIITFKQTTDLQLVPKTYKEWNIQTGYTPQITFDNYTTTVTQNNINPTNGVKLSQYHDEKTGLITSILWDATGTNPLAKIENATVNEVFYDGFDYTPNLNWAITGSTTTTNELTLNSTTTATATLNNKTLPAVGTQYVFEFDYKIAGTENVTISAKATSGTNISTFSLDASTRNVYRHKKIILPYQGTASKFELSFIKTAVTGNTNDVPVIIDNIRIYPIKARMTTYSFMPLVGVKSITDPAGVTSYYDYDNLGRLNTIKDANQDILKTYNYLDFFNLKY